MKQKSKSEGTLTSNQNKNNTSTLKQATYEPYSLKQQTLRHQQAHKHTQTKIKPGHPAQTQTITINHETTVQSKRQT